MELKSGPQFRPLFHWGFAGRALSEGASPHCYEGPTQADPGGNFGVMVLNASGLVGFTGFQAYSRDLAPPELAERRVPVAFRRTSPAHRRCRDDRDAAHGLVSSLLSPKLLICHLSRKKKNRNNDPSQTSAPNPGAALAYRQFPRRHPLRRCFTHVLDAAGLL